MLKPASPSEAVVYLVLRDKILFFYLHMVSRRECFPNKKQVVKLCPQFLFRHE